MNASCLLPASAHGRPAGPTRLPARHQPARRRRQPSNAGRRIAACNDCHTPGYLDKQGNVDKAEWMTGNTLGFHGPWGTTYPTNLRLKLADMDEASWLTYTANLHVRPMMPDFNVRAMHEDDRRAIYRFVRSLGAAGQPAPAFLPPGQTPPAPYLQLVLPPAAAPAAAPAAPAKQG